MAGPFFFAWVNADETEFNDSLIRNDEQVLSMTITQDEGDFASLTVEIVNPRIGLLNPGRKLWAWLSFADPDINSASESETESSEASELPFTSVVPLFFGRIVGMPDNLDADTVSITFLARPADYEAAKLAVAETKKVAPYWDPIWFAPDSADLPDNVLESRPELWHIDRITHEVTTSNIINGEDGNLSFAEGDVFYDSVSIHYGQVPVRRVNMIAAVSWQQMGTGIIDISSYLGNDPTGMSTQVVTYTGDKLLDSWPKPGTSIGGGWIIGEGTKIDQVSGGVGTWDYPPKYKFGRTEGFWDVICPEWAVDMIVLLTHFPPHVFHMPKWYFTQTTTARWTANRGRNETLSFYLEADIQAVVTDPGGEDVLNLSLSSSEIGVPDANGVLPIGDLRRSVYFSQPRGTYSIEYLISICRAQILARARCVEVGFSIPFQDAIHRGITCRKNAALYDSRLPGGVAAGKIKSYSLACNGDSGELSCDIVIGCTVGKGGTVSPVPGTPTWAAEGYVDLGYQVYDSQFVMPIAGEVTYESIEGRLATDDGIDLMRMTAARCVTGVDKLGSLAAQEAAMGTAAHTPEDVYTNLNTVPSQWRLNLRPLTGGPFTTAFNPSLSLLKIPKTIDLEAESI
jgi:hypothetical protein